MTSPNLLSTFELQERGWTPALIRDLLGLQDGERPNELRLRNRGRTIDAPVKLYLEVRVLQAEMTPHFLRSTERNRLRQAQVAKAVQTRHANHAQLVARYQALPPPELVPPPEAASMTGQRLWKHHQSDLYRWQLAHDRLLDGLPRALRREAESRAYERYRAAFRALYGDQSWT